ncbi:MAG: nucleotide-diphospho-sugar transferase [Cytophagales bacterium]|nr:nucleotide-diphospho-sugar transferase [Cytophagales bacterium]
MIKTISKPVLFIIFNRPDTTKMVFEKIREAKPPRLYIAADGPRSTRAGEEKNCIKTREVVSNVDWDCEVFTKFSDKNLGMKVAEYTAMNWFFENEEDGIILEDDTLPNNSFFWFCEELLNYYKNDTRIFHISGCNLQFGKKYGDGTYYFSRNPICWGWASWRRAWKYYDPNIKNYTNFDKLNHFSNIMVGDINKWQYKMMIKSIFRGRDTWDYQWSFAIQSQHGLCITPNMSLITNIGYRPDATTSTYTSSKLSKILSEDINTIVHPEFMVESVNADYYFNHLTFNQVPIPIRVINKLLRMLKNK